MSKDNNEVRAQLDLGEPPQDILDWAKENIREDPDTKCQLISDLRDMIFAKGECTPHRTDDEFLIRFLRARNWRVEPAHNLLVNYLAFKEDSPHIFKGVDLTSLQTIGKSKVMLVPPYREQTRRRMLTYRLGNWDPEEFTMDDIFKGTLLCLELAILEEQNQILGAICIFDLGGLSTTHMWHISPSVAYTVVRFMAISFPIKTYAVHVVNQPWAFDMIFNLFKPLIGAKMHGRIFFHGDNMESLHKHIDPKHLPKIYGGVHPDYDYNDWIKWFKKTERIQKEMEALGYDCEKILAED